jgi:hypothetical protein
VLGPNLVPQSDGHHFNDAALRGSGKIGVGFDSIDKHQPVSLVRKFAQKNGNTINFPHGDHIHGRPNRSTDAGFGNASSSQNCDLPVGGGTAVGTHCRGDERSVSCRFNLFNDCPNDLRKVGDTPAADVFANWKHDRFSNALPFVLNVNRDIDSRRDLKQLMDHSHHRQF